METFSTEFQQQLVTQHAVIENRIAALETEAKSKFLQVEELQQRLAKAEQSASRASDHSGYSGDRTNIQGAKLTMIYDQESGNFSFSDW